MKEQNEQNLMLCKLSIYKQNKISIKYYTKIFLWYSSKSIRVAKIMVSLIDILEIDYILVLQVTERFKKDKT